MTRSLSATVMGTLALVLLLAPAALAQAPTQLTIAQPAEATTMIGSAGPCSCFPSKDGAINLPT